MKDFIYGIHIPHGDLVLYGDNMLRCKPYLDDVVTASDYVEDLYDYCSRHELLIWHKPKRSIGGLYEIFRIRKLAKKYSVHSSWKELKQYLDSKQN